VSGTSGKLNHVGARRTGLTNVELALGKGTFVSDVQLPNMAHAAILRSPHAHARITSIDTSAAEALDGVLYVMTGREAEQAMRPIPEAWDTKEVGAKGCAGTRSPPAGCATSARRSRPWSPRTSTPPIWPAT
jgi:CO/xanthine dehydrogenase Mo-binding subunit